MVWRAWAELDGAGHVHAGGGIPDSAYSLSFDPTLQQWNLQLHDYSLEFPVDTLAVGDSIQFHVRFHLETSPGLAGLNPPPVPEPVTLRDLRRDDACGNPVWAGRCVLSAQPDLTLLSAPSFFGDVLCERPERPGLRI
jgi:hypothetical protein